MTTKLTPEHFNEILAAFQAKQTDTLAAKAKEYSQDNDRLHNFSSALQLIHMVSPTYYDRTYAMWCLASKQLVSVIDILNEPTKDYSEAFLTEKFGDVMNYFMLMYADLVQRNRQKYYWIASAEAEKRYDKQYVGSRGMYDAQHRIAEVERMTKEIMEEMEKNEHKPTKPKS